MVLGGILSAVGHMFAYMFKNVFIAVRRFNMDPANKSIRWNIEAFSLLGIFILCFFWLIGKYQDQYYGLSGPVFIRSIPLLIPCFLGHLIYSCPALFRNNYAKPVIQTFLNALSALALGQIILKFMPLSIGIVLAGLLFIIVVTVTLYYTLHMNVNSTIFNKIKIAVEQSETQKSGSKENSMILNMKKSKDSITQEELFEFDGIDLNSKGCLSHLRYYSEACNLELFTTIPTRERQSQLMTINRSDRAQHQQIIGGTGSAKTLFGTTLVAQDLLNDYIGTTIIEPKGSLINRLSNFMDRIGRRYYRLDPEYEFTDCMNPFYVPDGEDIEPMIEANVSAFHGYLGAEAEQYFKSRSTQLLRVGIKALKLARGNDTTYNDLDQLIQPLNDEFRAEILSELKDQLPQISLLLEYTRNIAGRMQEHTMKTYSNLYDYLSELTSNKYIQRIFCGPSTFNIDDVLRDGEVVFVNGAYGKLQTLTYTVGRLYINLLKASTFRRDLKGKVRPHSVMIDEVQNFVDEEFSTFFEMAREFEVFLTVIHQGNAQLDDVSERLGAMVKQNAVQKYVLAGLDPEDAEYYADLFTENYKLGQSSGTDEMSASGFKTQIKEEIRYVVMPAEILKLKGYNPETGEPAECLYRGVHNNVRLDPVVGQIYPLPLVLFSPLGEESIKVNDNKKMDVDLGTNNFDSLEQELEEVSEESKKIDRLNKIKENAQQRRENTPGHIILKESQLEDNSDMKKEVEQEGVIRNSFWDSGKDVVPVSEDKKDPVPMKFEPATIDDTTLKLAQRIKRASEEKRLKTENSEVE